MTDALVRETMSALLSAGAARAGVTPGAEDATAAYQWQALSDAGLTHVGVPEDAGGSGGSLADAADLLMLVGRHGAAVPLAETGLLGGWLLSSAQLALPPGALAVVPPDRAHSLRLAAAGDAFVLNGEASRVPWASVADHLVAVVPWAGASVVVRVPIACVSIEHGYSLASEPRDHVTAEAVRLDADCVGSAPTVAEPDQLHLRGAATRVLLIAGAIEGVLSLTGAYVSTRRQFGQPLRAFQAVAQQLALLAEQSALAQAAAALAVSALAGDARPSDAAAAKIIAGEAATVAARVSHQMHGAMGVAREYALQRLTLRLLSWRDEYGAETVWARRLGSTWVSRSQPVWDWLSQPLAADPCCDR